MNWHLSPLAFVDLETTGGRPGASRILEVGVVFVYPDGRVERFSELVNPCGYIPSAITELTGITPEMVADKPEFESVAPRLYNSLTNALFIAHNARFDYGFLRAEFAAAGLRFRRPVVCTVKLARKLFPEWPRHNLDTIIERLGLVCENRHRALDDADLLYQLWVKVLDKFSFEFIKDCIDELLVEPKIPSHLPNDLYDELPESSGVYFFYADDNRLLYVGKSRHIKQRVLEHFAKAERDAKEADLIRQTKRISFTETVGEYGALLREARLVKTHNPLVNRRLKANDQVGITLHDRADGSVLIDITAAEYLVLSPQTEGYGFFKNANAAKRALTEIARAHQLCLVSLGLEKSKGSCFAYQLQSCKGVCVGEESALKHSLRVKLALAALKIPTWPYPQAVAVKESNWMGEHEWHIFSQWCYLGSTQNPDELGEIAEREPLWDVDIYFLIKKILTKDKQSARSTVQMIKSAP